MKKQPLAVFLQFKKSYDIRFDNDCFMEFIAFW